MQFRIPIPQHVIWVFLIYTVFCSLASAAFDDQSCENGLECGSSQNPEGEKTIQNFMTLMDIISNRINEKGWGAETIFDTQPPIYALGQCHDDLSRKECSSCFNEARQCLPKCLPASSGRVHLDGCFLRYDNYSFFEESVDEILDKNICQSPTESSEKVELKSEFSKKLAAVIFNVTVKGGENKFAVGNEKGGAETVYALAQCWETIGKMDCEKCLAEARKNVLLCAPRTEGRCLYTGCFLRYSTRKFYNDTEEVAATDPTEMTRVGMIGAGVVSAIILLLLIILGAYLSWKKRIASSPKKSDKHGRMSTFSDKAGLNFRYELLEKATGFFDPSRKLGQGGAGSVFKGTLPTGETVAVKRLFFNTRQWVDEFFNEVNLINEIEHKNLVKLLGCSIEGPESLLVYEFLPNRSLDQILFGKDTVDILTWQQRFQIVSGIAEGLAYLHGGSGEKIIHRDIKTSNILLDENLNPKIADFGLARCIAADKSHLSTGVAGTLGYMAPEYLLRGQLTEQADVYAFGVLVVETVCGKKNSIFSQASASVLHCVWKNYKASNITASVDPALHGDFSVQEASKALQAGLLCTQSSVALRPSMSEVVQMLTNKYTVIPSPKQPPFLNASVLNPDDRTRTASMSSWLSNGRNSSYHSARSSTSSEPSIGDSFSSSAQFTTMSSPEFNRPAIIVAPEPR